jgi:hypothetical protein
MIDPKLWLMSLLERALLTPPLIAHEGRGTPRSKSDLSPKHKPAVDRWVEWPESR